jgi:hypothetical protein
MSLVKNYISEESDKFRYVDDTKKINSDFYSDNSINEKYMKGEIRIVTEQARYPLDSISIMLGTGRYDLNPEYQRRKRWDNIRKSKLIESFIMNVPIPPIFLYEASYSYYEVMDGLQRLTAINDFYKNEFALEGLEYWFELNGKKYNQLPEQVKRGIDRRYLSSIVLLQETAKDNTQAEELKQIVFERLNSGGEKLEPQETRNALHNGVFNQCCIKLSNNENFRKMWKLPLEKEGEKKLLESELYRKMGDVELVLRFFAYRHLDQFTGATVERFLDQYLKHANKYDSQSIDKLSKIFNSTIELIYNTIGVNAFLLPKIVKEYKKPTKTIYDSMMQAFAQNLENADKIISHAEDIKSLLYKDKESLFLVESESSRANNRKFLFDGRYNNKNDIKLRIDYFNKFLSQFIK